MNDPDIPMEPTSLPLVPRALPFGRHLGNGGYGTVYSQCRPGQSGPEQSEVAIKIVDQTSAGSYSAHCGEVLALSLSHANLVSVLGVEFSKPRRWGEMYVLMELWGHATVADLISARDASCRTSRALHVALCLGRSLAYLHNVHGLVHQDVKPDNILWCEERRKAKLCDFGTMRPAGAWTEERGAPSFRAPELRSAGSRAWHEVQPALDSWSAGIVVILLANMAGADTSPLLPIIHVLAAEGKRLAAWAPAARSSLGSFVRRLGVASESGLSPTRSLSAPCFGCF